MPALSDEHCPPGKNPGSAPPTVLRDNHALDELRAAAVLGIPGPGPGTQHIERLTFGRAARTSAPAARLELPLRIRTRTKVGV
ncbi:hypothetical protein ACH4TV_37265 [Streptomyces sp. NPDC020898]|uniref:hypothetical protein n=1 Tax=Streptomyces sp. NPDC020898 TaxID=3365101 RepID=UPI003789CC4D